MLKRWIQSFKTAGLWLEGGVSGDIETVDRMTSDSRVIAKTSQANERIVFFARRGPAKDGHEFLSDLSRFPQVAAFVVEKIPTGFQTKVPVILVRDTTEAMAIAAKDFYQNPTAETLCVAVTGTNGKTTTTFLVESLFTQMKRRPVRLGTIETHFEGIRIPSELTTPDFTELQKTFSELKQKGANAFVFEASSHALDQRRLLGLELDAAIFTNLTQDHLDYHKNMESYFEAKRKLFFDMLSMSPKKLKLAVLPEDGAYGSRLADELRVNKAIKVLTWSFQGVASDEKLVVEEMQTKLSGSEVIISGMGLKKVKFSTSLVGQYNIENVLGMIALGRGLGADASLVNKALQEQIPVRGRLERVAVPQGTVFVDYAHTPDALENVLMTLRPLTKGKLKVVFGCGGDRDRQKRPQMGAIAELYADEIFVTSDNPRTEDPEVIIQEILNGVQRLKPTHIDIDRKVAIAKSLSGLESDDVVLIAGKGHEDYQILGTHKVPFDDREVVSSSIEIRKKKNLK